jgi:hypothetical protein
MKFLFASLFLLISLSISAAYIENVAITLKQPNGAVIHCYITVMNFIIGCTIASIIHRKK